VKPKHAPYPLKIDMRTLHQKGGKVTL